MSGSVLLVIGTFREVIKIRTSVELGTVVTLMPFLHETHLPEVNEHFYFTALHFAIVKCIYLT